MAKKTPAKKWKLYKVSDGKVERSNPFCPKCGMGVFMANHKNRYHCGKCGYTEWKGKK